MSRHIADVIGFVEQLGAGPVDLMGHSRGGHISFRVAEQRPDLLRRLVLAEPGGELDRSLDPAAAPGPAGRAARIAASAESIAGGDIDRGLMIFYDAIEGEGAWARLPAAARQQLRDNAFTLVGQVGENRQPYSRAAAQSIRTPTLFIGGGATRGDPARGPARACRACPRCQNGDDRARRTLDVWTGAAGVLLCRAGFPGRVSALRTPLWCGRERNDSRADRLHAERKNAALKEGGIFGERSRREIKAIAGPRRGRRRACRNIWRRGRYCPCSRSAGLAPSAPG
jgi:hypothetical protein